jgi:hypothetical protein
VHDAGVLTRVDVADDPHYGIDAAAWARLLGLDGAPDLPFHHDWIPGFRTVTDILLWLDQPELDELSPYMRGSQARTLLDAHADDLRHIGVPAHVRDGRSSAQWEGFVDVARYAARMLIKAP